MVRGNTSTYIGKRFEDWNTNYYNNQNQTRKENSSFNFVYRYDDGKPYNLTAEHYKYKVVNLAQSCIENHDENGNGKLDISEFLHAI